MGAEGKTTVLSPRTNGDADPIAEWGTRLWNEGTDGSKEAAKRFWPKMRIFAPIVVRGEEDKGVRWWGFSRTTYQALLDVVLDPEYGDITDTEKGTDIRIDYGKKSGQAFPTTDVRPMRRGICPVRTTWLRAGRQYPSTGATDESTSRDRCGSDSLPRSSTHARV